MLPLQTCAVESTQILGPTNFRTLFMTNNLGAALEGTGQLDRAEDVLRQTLALRRKILGEQDSNTQRDDGFSGSGFARSGKPELRGYSAS